MNSGDLGALVEAMAAAARAAGRDSAEASLPDGTRVEIILRREPQEPLEPLARLLAAVAGQEPGRN